MTISLYMMAGSTSPGAGKLVPLSEPDIATHLFKPVQLAFGSNHLARPHLFTGLSNGENTYLIFSSQLPHAGYCLPADFLRALQAVDLFRDLTVLGFGQFQAEYRWLQPALAVLTACKGSSLPVQLLQPPIAQQLREILKHELVIRESGVTDAGINSWPVDFSIGHCLVF